MSESSILRSSHAYASRRTVFFESFSTKETSRSRQFFLTVTFLPSASAASRNRAVRGSYTILSLNCSAFRSSSFDKPSALSMDPKMER